MKIRLYNWDIQIREKKNGGNIIYNMLKSIISYTEKYKNKKYKKIYKKGCCTFKNRIYNSVY